MDNLDMCYSIKIQTNVTEINENEKEKWSQHTKISGFWFQNSKISQIQNTFSILFLYNLYIRSFILNSMTFPLR